MTVIRTKLRRPADASEDYMNNIYIQLYCTDLWILWHTDMYLTEQQKETQV